MNMPTLTNARSLIATTIFSVMLSSVAVVCSAAVNADPPQTVVKYADLDLSTSQGAAILYKRIRFAAEGVCAPQDGLDLTSKTHWESCVKQAIEGAVTKVDRPTVSLLYAAKYGAPPSAKVLTAQR